MTTIIGYILPFLIGIIVLGILVFVHELGHFITAKLCHVRVLAFSLGFGKPLLTIRRGDTEYRLSAIPFGGYVQMAGENPEDETSGAPDELPSRPRWQRALIMANGPVANVLLAFVLLWVVYVSGVEIPQYTQHTVIGTVEEGSPAARAGLRHNDSIVSINGNTVSDWDDIGTTLTLNQKSCTVRFVRNGTVHTVTLRNDSLPTRDNPLGGYTAGLSPALPPVVGSVEEGSAADSAGLATGDSIIRIDTAAVRAWADVRQKVGAYDSTQHPGGLPVTFVRNDSVHSLVLRPRYHDDAGRFLIGIAPSGGKTITMRYNPAAAIGQALRKSGEYASLLFVSLQKLITREVPANQISGPVTIVQVSGTFALAGLIPILNFMALVSINLAIINLLPLVITDGGQLLFLGIEAIRGRPLPLKYQLIITRAAIVFFIALFIVITLNDIRRIPYFFNLN
jgi:regulator of sigma E protease